MTPLTASSVDMALLRKDLALSLPGLSDPTVKRSGVVLVGGLQIRPPPPSLPPSSKTICTKSTTYRSWQVTTSVSGGPTQAADNIKHLELELHKRRGEKHRAQTDVTDGFH